MPCTPRMARLPAGSLTTLPCTVALRAEMRSRQYVISGMRPCRVSRHMHLVVRRMQRARWHGYMRVPVEPLIRVPVVPHIAIPARVHELRVQSCQGSKTSKDRQLSALPGCRQYTEGRHGTKDNSLRDRKPEEKRGGEGHILGSKRPHSA